MNTSSKQPLPVKISKKLRSRTLATPLIAFLAIILLAAACGRSSESDSAAEQTTATTENICTDVELEATEIGISASTITLLVIADIGSPLAPGLFQGSIDGARAKVNHINRNGGLGCRQIELIEHDSKLEAIATTNGFLRACEEALATVGSTALFALNTEALNTCDDKAGNPTGLPDLPERAVEPSHECSPNSFNVSGRQGVCPYSGSGERTYFTQVGGFKRLLREVLPDAHGVFLVPSDLASTIAALTPVNRAAQALGIGIDAEFGVSGFTPQAGFAAYLQAIRDNDSNYAFSGSNDEAMIKWRKEAAAQGGFDDIVWGCILTCYTPSFAEAPESAGVTLSLNFLPYNERHLNEDMDLFLTEINDDLPPSWAAGAWASVSLFETVVNEIVAEDGPNGITRAKILEKLRALRKYDGKGWFGEVDLSTGINSACFVTMEAKDGNYVRLYPEEPGTFDCNPDNLLEHTIDAAKEFQDGP